ncbi:chemotaxis-specific protein-glutamate methyltransferase CheB [Maridesulfovibrio zosterae]|uniref:chemotaxis-specific protein-glutamate methyltransferase CheB n=1 Tax=Maridesulfovibrio zosterae TaxID=82171 RepID=UPI0004131259|nr:chemotaxis-specific protein-glutamate methyltransferase CheB [Maridesulfovibrio zosterae]
MKIGIVNEAAVAVEILKKVVLSAEYDVIWIAHNGEQAVDKCRKETPDLVLMDLVMPVMDGIEATRLIMSDCPCPVLIVTASIEDNSSKIFEAMGAGALDVVPTPEIGPDGNLKGAEGLIAKISVIKKLSGNGKESSNRKKIESCPDKVPPVLAIGSSTGGPSALALLLGSLPENFPAAIVIVQHVDGQFSDNLAQWLDRQTKIEVSIACNGESVKPGRAYLAPGDKHMLMGPCGTIQITSDPGESLYVPSVDLLFESLCCADLPQNSVAVLLTGMGADGARGLLGLKKSAWLTIAQDEESSVVWGMPGAAVKMDAACEICSLDEMSRHILRHFKKDFRR